MIWWALIIPLLVSGVAFIFYHHKINPLELFLPTIVSLLAIVISYYTMKSISLSDVEYNGYVVTEARYYEYWETWVSKTCSRTVCTGSGKTRTCHTYYYDCSYCDENPAYWEMIDSGGNKISISESKYKQLIQKWSATPFFTELERSIKNHGSCGKDGDMYYIKWDKKIETSETSTFEESFTNILKCNHSAFNYPVIENSNGLFDYPEVGNQNKQPTVLGLDSIDFPQKRQFKVYMDYLNGYLGARNKVRIYTLFFKDKDINQAFLQEVYWDGGNRNEVVVCVGTDKKGNISWVKPFSWTDNKKTLIDIREDIMEKGVIDTKLFYDTYKKSIEANYHFKDFEDFNYLSFEPTTGQLIFVYIFTVIITIGTLIWCIKNEY